MTKHEGYKMRTEKYVAHFLSPTDETGIPIRARVIPVSGSPSAVWGLIKEHLNVGKDHPTSELKARGWKVLLVHESEKPQKIQGMQPTLVVLDDLADPTPTPVLGKGLQDLINERDKTAHDSGWMDGPSDTLDRPEIFEFPHPEPERPKLIHNPWLWIGLILGTAIAGVAVITFT